MGGARAWNSAPGGAVKSNWTIIWCGERAETAGTGKAGDADGSAVPARWMSAQIAH